MRLLVTGATGFVGKRVLEKGPEQALEQGLTHITAISRSSNLKEVEQTSNLTWSFGDLTKDYDWSGALADIDCVIHCAAKVHQQPNPTQTLAQQQASYDAINFDATMNLANQAAKAGVKRFIFISTIKVNGEQTQQGHKFTPEVNEAPSDPYGLSKYKAEKALLALSKRTNMEVVIIRPPLVYGQGVKANFAAMIKWASRPVPLPLGAIHNQRSMVFIDNLVDLILTCISHPNAANQVFLVSDDHDISTTQLLKKIKQLSGSFCILLPIPMSWFGLFSRVANKPETAQKLCSSLQVDISHTQKQLNWQPPVSWEQGLSETVTDYLQSNCQ